MSIFYSNHGRRFLTVSITLATMIGDNIVKLTTTTSTNNYAQMLLNNGNLAEGTVVVSAEQTQGKGMQGGKWESDTAMNLTFSTILYPGFIDMDYFFSLNQVAVLGVCEALREVSGYDFMVKWPNDIMFHNKKIAGILIENNLRSNVLNSSIVGIGININQMVFGSYVPEAVSMKMITGIDYDLFQLLGTVCNKMNDYYDILKMKDYNFLHREYHRFLFRYNEKHLFQKNGSYFKGVIKGVRADGKMLLADEKGINQVIDVKEIKYVY